MSAICASQKSSAKGANCHRKPGAAPRGHRFNAAFRAESAIQFGLLIVYDCARAQLLRKIILHLVEGGAPATPRSRRSSTLQAGARPSKLMNQK